MAYAFEKSYYIDCKNCHKTVCYKESEVSETTEELPVNEDQDVWFLCDVTSIKCPSCKRRIIIKKELLEGL